MAIITLLTDFGLQDASAGAARGVLLSAMPQAHIIDISHEVPPFRADQGAYLLSTSYRNFPEGTIHLVIIDVFNEPIPKLVLSSHNGQYFLAPDNGIIPLALGTMPAQSWLCFEFTKDKTFSDWLHSAADTIRILGSLGTAGIGLPSTSLKKLSGKAASAQGGESICAVRYIDHYGNVVTDMDLTRFTTLNKNGRFRLNFMKVNEITAISANYSDVPAGDSLCRFNHNGYLEICVNQGSASSLFGFRTEGTLNDIKITFE